jgi:hypothetical protein
MIPMLIALAVLCLHGDLPVKPLKQPKIATQVSQIDLAHVLRAGHQEVFGREPSPRRLAMGWAQVALENGQGQRVYNHNLGNIGASGKTFYYVVGGHKFLSNRDFKEGARRYWLTLKEMCPSSLRYFDAGDAVGAAKQLRRCGYYRAEIGHYSNLMTQLFYTASLHVINKIEEILPTSPVKLGLTPDLSGVTLPIPAEWFFEPSRR